MDFARGQNYMCMNFTWFKYSASKNIALQIFGGQKKNHRRRVFELMRWQIDKTKLSSARYNNSKNINKAYQTKIDLREKRVIEKCMSISHIVESLTIFISAAWRCVESKIAFFVRVKFRSFFAIWISATAVPLSQWHSCYYRKHCRSTTHIALFACRLSGCSRKWNKSKSNGFLFVPWLLPYVIRCRRDCCSFLSSSTTFASVLRAECCVCSVCSVCVCICVVNLHDCSFRTRLRNCEENSAAQRTRTHTFGQALNLSSEFVVAYRQQINTYLSKCLSSICCFCILYIFIIFARSSCRSAVVCCCWETPCCVSLTRGHKTILFGASQSASLNGEYFEKQFILYLFMRRISCVARDKIECVFMSYGTNKNSLSFSLSFSSTINPRKHFIVAVGGGVNSKNVADNFIELVGERKIYVYINYLRPLVLLFLFYIHSFIQ